jgi:hypothetical protein
MSSSCFLAQINIARASAPLDDPRMAGSVSRLADMNAAAEQSRGFVWRLTDEGAESAYLRAYDDPSIVVNMSVWESIEALSDYVYRSEHVSPLRDRARWFNRLEVPHLALWWTPPDHLPTLVEGKERLAILQQQGPTPLAFTFKRRFRH